MTVRAWRGAALVWGLASCASPPPPPPPVAADADPMPVAPSPEEVPDRGCALDLQPAFRRVLGDARPSCAKAGGLVALSGTARRLDRLEPGVRAGALGWLSEAARPDRQLVFAAATSTGVARVKVAPSGQVSVRPAEAAMQVSLTGVTYSREAGTPIELAAGVAPSGPAFGVPSYALHAGLVVLSGHVTGKGQLVGTLPAEARPARPVSRVAFGDDGPRVVTIQPTGEIRRDAAVGALSLAGLSFPAASAAAVESLTSTAAGTRGYRIDGFVHFEASREARLPRSGRPSGRLFGLAAPHGQWVAAVDGRLDVPVGAGAGLLYHAPPVALRRLDPDRPRPDRTLDRGPPRAVDPREALEWRQAQFRKYARFGRCTATHIGRGFFLTAGHCVTEEPGYVGYRNTPCPGALELSDGTYLRCEVVAFSYDAWTDYAVLRATPAEFASTLPSDPIDYSFEWARRPARAIRLFGLSQDKLRVNRECGARYEPDVGRVIHDCTTEGGDSGSALIDRRTGHIVGVHGGALDGIDRYAWPIGQVPWAETVCAAIGTKGRRPLAPRGAPVTLRVSTSHLEGDFQRLVIDLEGRVPRDDLELTVWAPEVEVPIPVSQLDWRNDRDWRWHLTYVLSVGHRGPWAVRVRNRGTTEGSVGGRVWVCP